MNISTVVVLCYLALMLVVGLIFSRNCRSVRSYSIANKQYGSFLLVMTFLATSFGAGSTVGDTAKIMQDGYIFPLSMLGFFVFCIYMIKCIAPKFDNRFEGMLSAGDIIAKYYGKKAANISAVVGFIAGGLLVGSQITGVGHIFESTSNFSYQEITIAAGGIIALYSALGGVRSVVMTDLIQALIMLIAVPIFTYSMVSSAGGLSAIINSMPESNYLISRHPKFHEFGLYFIVCFMPFLWLYPPVVQRLLMAQNVGQIQQMYKFEFVLRITLILMLIMVAASAFVLIPNTDPSLALGTLLKTHGSEFILSVILLLILAASMSTADSHLNAATILLCHNALKSFLTTDRKELFAMKAASLLIGIIAIMIALLRLEIVPLVIFAFSLSGCVIGIPLFFGIMGMQVTRLQYYSCLGCSITSLVLTLCVWQLKGMYPSSIAILCGTSGFIVPYIFGRSYSLIRGVC